MVKQYAGSSSIESIIDSIQCLRTDLSILRNRAMYLLGLTGLAVILLGFSGRGFEIMPVAGFLVLFIMTFNDRISISHRMDSIEDLISMLQSELEKGKLLVS